MILPYQRAMLENELAILKEAQSSKMMPLTSDSIGMIFGLVILIILLIVFFVFVAYCLPWWSCYNLFCTRCVEMSCCNCLKCFFYCPCADDKAYVVNQKNQTPGYGGKMFVQDMFAAADGSIIHLSDMRAINGFNQPLSVHTMSMPDFNIINNPNHESGLI